LKKFIIHIPLLFLAIFIGYGQNPKQKNISYYAWNYRTINTTSNTIGFSIDEEERPIIAAVFYANGDRDNFIESSKGATVIASSFITQLDLWSLETVPFNEAGVKVFLTPEPTIFKIIGYKGKRGSNGDQETYEGQLKIQNRIKIEIKDANGNLLEEKTIEDLQELHSISAFNNSAINSEQKAIDLVKEYFLEDKDKYFADASGSISGPFYYKLIEYLQDALDVRRKKNTLYLYTYNNKKGFDFTVIDNSIDELTSLSEIKPDNNYQTVLEDNLLPKIDVWRAEISKYSSEDKKGVKIIWGLLANISGAFHALGMDEKALQIYSEIEKLDYRDSYTYLMELPTDQLKSQQAYAGPGNTQIGFVGTNFKGTHNPSFVHYTNSKGNSLGVNDAVESEFTIKKRQDRAFILNKILGNYQYLEELKRLSKKYTDKGDVNIGFEETDAYFVEVFNRVVEESVELKFIDLSILDQQEKVLATKITKDFIEFYENYSREISLNSATATTSEELSQLFDKQMVILTKLFLDEKAKKRDLDNDIIKLTDLMMKENNEVIRQLPFLEILLDELSSEGKLSYTKKPKLYKEIFKRYQKTYVSLFVSDTSIKQYLHHSALTSIKQELIDYFEFYRADLDEIETKFKNVHDEKRVIKILATFMK
tara:strand:- start:2018 stop:3970 length:1953 start_codon:yes stop_codon:yes gene_type:complete